MTNTMRYKQARTTRHEPVGIFLDYFPSFSLPLARETYLQYDWGFSKRLLDVTGSQNSAHA